MVPESCSQTPRLPRSISACPPASAESALTFRETSIQDMGRFSLLSHSEVCRNHRTPRSLPRNDQMQGGASTGAERTVCVREHRPRSANAADGRLSAGSSPHAPEEDAVTPRQTHRVEQRENDQHLDDVDVPAGKD